MAEEENQGQENKNPETETAPDEGEENNPDDDDEADEESAMESGGFGSFFSPEAVLMFPLAILLDMIGVVLIIFGLDDFFITDIIGISLIGVWTFFRSRQVQMTQGAQQKIGKFAKRAQRLRWLRPLLMLGELIPYVGVLPCWTILVYLELKG